MYRLFLSEGLPGKEIVTTRNEVVFWNPFFKKFLKLLTVKQYTKKLASMLQFVTLPATL